MLTTTCRYLTIVSLVICVGGPGCVRQPALAPPPPPAARCLPPGLDESVVLGPKLRYQVTTIQGIPGLVLFEERRYQDSTVVILWFGEQILRLDLAPQDRTAPFWERVGTARCAWKQRFVGKKL